MTAKKIIARSFLLIFGLLLLFVGYFLLIRKLDNNAVNAPDFGVVQAYKASEPVLLPTRFIDGARFYFKMATDNADTLLAFGDTGGGLCMAMPRTIDKLRMQKHVRTGLLKGVMPMRYIRFEDVVKDARFPMPAPVAHLLLRRYFQQVKDAYLLVPKEDGETKMIQDAMPINLFLGQNFFRGHAWTIDYPRQQIWVNTPLADGPHVQPVGFRKSKAGRSIYGHPAIVMEVEGDTIDVLFDTGASLVLSEEGKRVFNTQEKTIAGSFIAASVFDRWRKAHPDWRYFPGVEKGSDAIEVPRVKLGEQTVGPALFARRPDAVWGEEGMAQSMDRVVKGAIGGSALRYLRVVIDYNSERIRFEQSTL